MRKREAGAESTYLASFCDKADEKPGKSCLKTGFLKLLLKNLRFLGTRGLRRGVQGEEQCRHEANILE